MARDEHEYEMFQQLDQDRYEVEDIEERKKLIHKMMAGKKKFVPNYNYRLI